MPFIVPFRNTIIVAAPIEKRLIRQPKVSPSPTGVGKSKNPITFSPSPAGEGGPRKRWMRSRNSINGEDNCEKGYRAPLAHSLSVTSLKRSFVENNYRKGFIDISPVSDIKRQQRLKLFCKGLPISNDNIRKVDWTYALPISEAFHLR